LNIVVLNLRKSSVALILLTLLLPILIITLFNINSTLVKAESSPSPFDVQVEHTVQIRDGGLIVINDTVKLSTQSEQNVKNFTLGFPFRYKFDLDYVYAYPTSNPNARLKVELDTGLGTIGFYGVNVRLNATFPEDDVKISEGAPYSFTVVFVFSNRISFQPSATETLFNATFPAYPSLTLSASTANLTIWFPRGASYVISSLEAKGVASTNTTQGAFRIFSYTPKSNLTEFADEPAWFSFSASADTFKIIEVNEVRRDISLEGYESLFISDSYQIISKSSDLSKIGLLLPSGAYGVTAMGIWGQIPSDRLTITSSNVTITFSPALSRGSEGRFTLNYILPWKDHVNTQTWSNFYVNLTLFDNDSWIIRKWTTTVTLPEGATLLSQPPSTNLNSLTQSAYQTTLIFVFYNATPFQNVTFNFTFGYTVFWESFRPTLWMGATVTVVAVVAGLWRMSKPAVTLPTVPVYPKELKSFVDTYEEKRKMTLELESLERQAQKGKIPRRQYKVRRRTLESRLAVLSRELATLREKIRMVGARYSDMMRQIEVAEAETQAAEAEIRRTEVRYRRGETPASVYRELLESSYKRRERAKTTIDGVLLRLREDIS